MVLSPRHPNLLRNSLGNAPADESIANRQSAEDLLSLAEHHARQGRDNEALVLNAQVLENPDLDEALRRRAQNNSQAITGEGGLTRERAEYLADRFVDQVMDPASLGAMVGAGLTYRGARFGLGALAYRAGMGGLGTRVGTALGAFALEATAFPLYHRLGDQALGRSADWSREGLQHAIAGSFLMLGGLKLFGFLGGEFNRWYLGAGLARNGVAQRILPTLVSQTAMYLGIVAGSRAEQWAGLAPRQGMGQLFGESLATLVNFNGAGRILPVITPPELQAVERQLELGATQGNREQLNLQTLMPRPAGVGISEGFVRSSATAPRENFPNAVFMASRPRGSGPGRGSQSKQVSPLVPYERVLRNGIRALDQLPQAFDCLEAIHPRWRGMVQTLDRLRQARIERGELGSMGESFAIQISEAGSFSQRSALSADRRQDLSDGIGLHPGASLFTLVHELTHALPLEHLPVELMALPYEEVGFLDEAPQFETVFRRLLEQSYQDEAISGMAEVLLYRDLMAMDESVASWLEAEELAPIRAMAEVFEREGLPGYLRSELYIGRNHRSSYNWERLVQAALLLTLEPRWWGDPGLAEVLSQGGLQVETSGNLGRALGGLRNLIKDPSRERLRQWMNDLQTEGVRIQLDVPRLLSQVQEALALMRGDRSQGSASFLGRRPETMARMALLAEARRHFENYRDRFLELRPARRRSEWEDEEGLITLYRLSLLQERGAEPEWNRELRRLESQIRKALRREHIQATLKIPVVIEAFHATQNFLEASLNLERDRLRGASASTLGKRLGAAMRQLLLLDGSVSLKILTESLGDQQVMALFNEADLNKGMAKGIGQGSSSLCNGIVDDLSELPQQNVVMPFFQILSPHMEWARSLELSHYISQDRLKNDEAMTEFWGDWEILLHQSLFAHGAKPFKFSPLEAMGIPVLLSGKRALTDEFGMSENEYKHQDTSYSHFLEVLNYQSVFARIRRGQNVNLEPFFRLEASPGYGESVPTLFWLESSQAYVPPGLQVYPRAPVPGHSRALVAKGMLPFLGTHLFLERAIARGEDIKTEDWQRVAQSLSFSERQESLNGEALWAWTHLGIRWARLAAERSHEIPEHGLEDWARNLISTLKVDILQEISLVDTINFETGLGPAMGGSGLGNEIEQALILAERLLPFHFGATTDTGASLETRRQLLQELQREYEVTVRLRRPGFSPALLAVEVAPWAADPELRPQVRALLELAIRHAAGFDPNSPHFRNAVPTLLRVFHESTFTHRDREDLLTQWLRQILPENPRSEIPTTLQFQRQLRQFHWLRDFLLAPETLDLLGHYPRAEVLVLDWSRRLLSELGSVPLPLGLHGEVLSAAFCWIEFMHRFHPEVMDATNLERLAEVSDDPAYQQDLAQWFPSRRVQVDESLPVADWDPRTVRQGLRDEAAAWDRLRESLTAGLAGEASGAAVPERVLSVYENFVLHQVEASGRPVDLIREAGDFFQTFKRREREMQSGGAHTAARTAMTLYAQGLNLLSRREQVFLDQLLTLPSVAWAWERAQQAFEVGRDFTAAERRFWHRVLSAPTLADAARKRELFLTVLAEERFPLELRRQAVLNLAQGSSGKELLERLISSYQANGDLPGEERSYRLLTQYWRRLGQVPDARGLLILDHYGAAGESQFWREFDRVSSGVRGDTLTEVELELSALRQGAYAGRFLEEAAAFLTRPANAGELLTFQDNLQALLGPHRDQAAALLPLIEAVQRRHRDREEQLELTRQNLPAAFVRQPAELRYLLSRFLTHLPQQNLGSLLEELRELEGTSRDAEVFVHFFSRTGLEKAGQFLSTLVGLIPPEDRRTFAVLQDRVAPSSFAEVRRTLETQWGRPVEQVLSEIFPEPVASASMGEVYRARLHDGREVLVKVCPPSKRHVIQAAIGALDQVAADYEAEQGRFTSLVDVAGMIRRFTVQLGSQLDFNRERRNAMTLGGWDEGEYQVPRFVYDVELPDGSSFDIATESVTVMLPARGQKITELSEGVERREAAAAFVRQALRMLLVDRAYHGDPHPGNAFWDAAGERRTELDERLTWLDWGVTGRLSETGRTQLRELLVGAALGNRSLLENFFRQVSPTVSPEVVTQFLDQAETEGVSGATGETIQHLLTVAGRHRIFLNDELTQAVSYLLIVEGVARELDPQMDFNAEVLQLLNF